MLTNEKLIELRDDIMREMYSEANPGLDWDDLLENPNDYDDVFYYNHTIDAKREREIFEKHVDDADVTTTQETLLEITCIVDFGPTTTVSVE